MINENSVLSKATVEGILSTVHSGIGLDIAKNHTGVSIWNGKTVETYGFALNEYDKNDPFALYKMRRDLKVKLSEIVVGRDFEVCIVEDVYGGENFDTVRKLLNLNTVIDELIFDRVCTVDKFFRWNEPKWLSAFRTVYKQRGRLKSKVETQGILEFLNWDFYKNNCGKTDSEKKEIFFEDICDSCGMLVGVVQQLNMDINLAKATSLRISDIKMYYIGILEECYSIRDSRVREEGFLEVDITGRNIEKELLTQAGLHPEDVMCAFLPSNKLGIFGMKHKFTFFDGEEEGYLVFYRK